MKRITTLCLLLALLASPALAETVSKIAAIVNDDIITRFQLGKAMTEEREAQALDSLSAGAMKRLQRQILERMIEEKLFQQRARELGLTATESELESAINDVQRQNNMNREQLIVALQEQGMDFAAYRESLKKEILRFKLIRIEVNDKVKVSNKEIRAYFRDHIDEYRVAPTIHLKRISFKVPSDATPEQQAAIREQAEVVRNKLMIDKESFDVVLESLGNAADGDDMGSVEEGALLPIFQGPIRTLKIGEVSVPIATIGGLHLFLVADRNPGDSNLFERVKDEIEEILRDKNTGKRYAEWSRELREKAYIEIRL